jgi:serine/threonine-protein kinase
MRQHPEQIRHVLTSIISGAAEGVGYLHRKGWLHRDIKPDNFLASPDGEVKLIDFSIAERSKKGLTRLLSGRSKIQGTLSYMSPEQIRGESLDCRSDIYSFGCTLYEVVAEKVPYTGTSADELLTKHLRAPVPALLSANGAVTAEFSELVGRMMGKDPKERPATMEEFLEEFEKIRVFRVRPKPPADQTRAKGQTP